MIRITLLALTLLWPISAIAQSDRVPVVATFSILGDITAAIGGGHIALTVLVPNNTDVHSFQPTPADSKALAQAKLVIVNGLGLEGWIDRLVKASGYGGPIVVAAKGVKPVLLEAAAGNPKPGSDPHAWQNLKNGVIYARNIAAGLALADPVHADVYRANADDYIAKLEDTDAWVRAEIVNVPISKRKIITSHDAFAYFGSAYGVTFVGARGLSTDSEPTAAQIAGLIRQVRRDRIKAVFVENMTDPRLIEQVAKETGAVIGGTVYSDTLSPPGGPADTYLKMFRYNVPLFVAAMARN